MFIPTITWSACWLASEGANWFGSGGTGGPGFIGSEAEVVAGCLPEEAEDPIKRFNMFVTCL